MMTMANETAQRMVGPLLSLPRKNPFDDIQWKAAPLKTVCTNRAGQGNAPGFSLAAVYLLETTKYYDKKAKKEQTGANQAGNVFVNNSDKRNGAKKCKLSIESSFQRIKAVFRLCKDSRHKSVSRAGSGGITCIFPSADPRQNINYA